MAVTRKRKRNGPSPMCIVILTFILIGVVSNLAFLKNYNNSALPSPNVGGLISGNNNADFDLAKKESFEFFDDVSSANWKLHKERVKWQAPNYNGYFLPVWDEKTGIQRAAFNRKLDENGTVISLRLDNRNRKGGHFYQNHFEPEFACQHERRIGSVGDGGKWICDPHRIANQIDKKCLVYSIGSNNDFTFEMSVQQNIGEDCEIHTFDPGEYQQGADKAKVNYHKYFVGLDDKRSKSIATIVKELGHEGRTIDIFKIDCEGCEWTTAKHWFDAPVTIRQIQVELHRHNMKTTPEFFDLMWHNHYVITHKEPNIAYPGSIEYSFLKLAPEFFEGIDRQNASMPAGFFEKFPNVDVGTK